MTDDFQALIVTRRPAKEMADGTLRVQIDVEPSDRRSFLDMFPDNGDPVAVFKLEPEAVQKHQQQTAFADAPTKKKPHGDFAQWLVQSGFFRRLDVWKLVGNDAAFLKWIKTQRCAVRNKECAGDVVPAHVRRVASGAGTGVKPPYSAIPLCDFHHKIQHAQGESALGGKEWFDRARVRVLGEWAKEAFKDSIELDSLGDLSPHGLEHALRNTEINVDIPTRFFDYMVEGNS